MKGDEGEGNRFAQAVFGVILMLVGAALLLDRIGIADLGAYWRYWPLTLIVIGLGNWLTPGDHDGGWFVFFGLVFLAHSLDYLPLGRSWPLFLVAAGASVAWRSLRSPQGVESTEVRHDS